MCFQTLNLPWNKKLPPISKKSAALANGTHCAQLPSGLLTQIVPISQSSELWSSDAPRRFAQGKCVVRCVAGCLFYWYSSLLELQRCPKSCWSPKTSLWLWCKTFNVSAKNESLEKFCELMAYHKAWYFESGFCLHEFADKKKTPTSQNLRTSQYKWRFERKFK